ncbi:MAG: tetratricopeptide repeat protein [Candidatus Competibacteraceae bacterium]|nr:tetratricopeptide repeat protein [Candidatus Competibacteraceae bacterium]
MPWRKPQPVLNDHDFQRFRALILARTGLVFDEKRREVVAQALTEEAHQAGALSLERYFNLLVSNPTHGSVWEPLISALTVNESYFFRDAEQIEALRRRLLPDVIARCRSRRRLRLWSAGCATGEEPYTLAILLHQLIPDLERWDVRILATDIDRQALRQAERATYRDWSFRNTGEAIRLSYFNNNGNSLELHPHLRRLVKFSYLNLAEDAYPTPGDPLLSDLDLILCRNVTIYLPEPVIHAIAGRFYQCLASGGWLMVGASETSDQRYHPFQAVNQCGITIYQKAGKTAEIPGKAVRPIRLPAEEATKEIHPGWHEAPSKVDPPNAPPSLSPSIVPEVVPPNAAILYREGKDWLRQRRLADARRCFEACLSQEPGHSAACRELARLEANAGRLAEARRWVEQALEREPLQVESHYLLALIEQEQGEINPAVARFRKVIYLEPDFILAHVHLGDLYQKLGQSTAAARHRAQALRLSDRLPTDTVLPGFDDITAGQVLTLLQNLPGH